MAETSSNRRIVVLNGPNLNLLGQREPDVYGEASYADLEKAVAEYAAAKGFAADVRQSNHEGELVDWLHEAEGAAVGVILNAGALTHTSIALADAVRAVSVPVIEVHLSNIFAREEFRRRSYLSEVAKGVISGFGIQGYKMAIDAIALE
ncbi:MAG: type II 3-dehydroquinate dehydratase [Sphingomonadales bacterium]|nr:type II 3-dehydroquinate dehydratase [Sphingomonadales bacterium]